MRAIVMGIVCVGLLGLSWQARAAADHACAGALQTVSAEWDAAGFPTPAKPGQMRVVGRDGRIASGAQVNYMRTQLTLAAHECTAGNDGAAIKRVAAIHNLLKQASLPTLQAEAR